MTIKVRRQRHRAGRLAFSDDGRRSMMPAWGRLTPVVFMLGLAVMVAPVAGAASDPADQVEEKPEYLDRLSAANEPYGQGEIRAAITAWEALQAGDLLPSTWGKVTFNLGVAHKELGEYDEAIRAFESIFPSRVDDQEPGAHIMEEFRNYRYRACLQISSCHEAKGDIPRALEYARLAREQYTYQAHCANCAEDAPNGLRRWTEHLESAPERPAPE